MVAFKIKRRVWRCIRPSYGPFRCLVYVFLQHHRALHAAILTVCRLARPSFGAYRPCIYMDCHCALEEQPEKHADYSSVACSECDIT